MKTDLIRVVSRLSYFPFFSTVSHGGVAFKSSYLYDIFSVKTKIAILSWRRIPLTILLYEQ